MLRKQQYRLRHFPDPCKISHIKQAFLWNQGRTQGEGGRGSRAAHLRIKNSTHIVDTVISDVSRDLLFSPNQPLKSADEWYVRIFENKMEYLRTS